MAWSYYIVTIKINSGRLEKKLDFFFFANSVLMCSHFQLLSGDLYEIYKTGLYTSVTCMYITGRLEWF